MSGLTLHGRVLALGEWSKCLAVLTSEERDNDGHPLHSETVEFLATEPLYKGGLVLSERAARVPGATLASVKLFGPTTEEEARRLEGRDRLVEIGDDANTHIGLDELVEAFLIPNFNSREDHGYWRRFIGLTCAVFGLEHHAWEIELARSQIARSVVPLQQAMEVPESFGVAFRRHRARIEQLTDGLKSLQRGVLRDALLAMDPQLEQRSTTVGRLRELGLPARPYLSWDDM